MEEKDLFRSVGVEKHSGYVVRWEAWHALDDLCGEAVKRNVHVEIKDSKSLLAKIGDFFKK